MKKYYESPEAEFEKFTLPDNCVMTASGGLGDAENPYPDPFGSNGIAPANLEEF